MLGVGTAHASQEVIAMNKIREFRWWQTGRIAILGLACILGGAIVLYPKLRGVRDGSVPPILTVAEAQSQIRYSLYVPRKLPPGVTLRGASVYEIHVRNMEEVRKQVRANQKPFTGYGLMLIPQGDRIMGRAVPGSPAEKAGVPSNYMEIVAMNGRPLGSSAREAWVRASAATHAAPPLKLKLRDPSGGVRNIEIARRETFMAGAEMPILPRKGKLAALQFRVRGRQFFLMESPSPSETPMPAKERSVLVRGITVWLSGPENTPSAFWTEGGLDFGLDNYQYALTQDEVLQIIGAMAPAR
jgi:hypothetical protein